MCDDPTLHDALPDPDHREDDVRGLSRRGLLGGAGLLAATALVPGAGRAVAAPLRGAAAALGTTAAGQLVVPMAMHVHGSFSEGAGGVCASWETQLTEARAAGVAVLWPTDHDWRMSAYEAPTVFHTAELAEQVDGRRYTWEQQASGALASSSAGALRTPASPDDRSARTGSLRVEAVSKGAAEASQRLYLDAGSSNHTHRTNIAGQVLRLQVRPEAVGPDAWGEVLVSLSHHPATGGRPAGIYQLSYRFGAAPGGVRADGLLGIVSVPVTAGRWNEVVLDLTADVARAWPDLVAEDNALIELWVGATSRRRQRARVLFSYLRFAHDSAGQRPLQAQAAVFAAHRSRFPDVTVHRGLEVSVGSAHVNWFGGDQRLVDYGSGEGAGKVGSSKASYVSWSAGLVHAYGGLASLNHPFGSSGGAAGQDAQVQERRTLAAQLVPTRAHGVDVLEVGYRVRGGASLETHLALWDTLSRAGVWLTGNGVNDAHGGKQNDWRALTNRFVTTALADGTGEPALLAALAGGRVFVQELGGFAGLLDAQVETCPMGSVSVRPDLTRRVLTVTATDLPTGSSLRVLQGLVDFGTAVDPSVQVAAVLPAAALRGGSTDVVLDTTTSTFVRVELVTSAGRTVAFTNPIWLLTRQPPVAPAPARRAPDSR